MSSVAPIHDCRFDFTSQNMMSSRSASVYSSRNGSVSEINFDPSTSVRNPLSNSIAIDDNYVLAASRRIGEPDVTQHIIDEELVSEYDLRTDTSKEGVFQASEYEVDNFAHDLEWENPRATLEQALEYDHLPVIAQIDGPGVVIEKWLNGRIDALNARVDEAYNQDRPFNRDLVAKVGSLPPEIQNLIRNEVVSLIQHERSFKQEMPVHVLSDILQDGVDNTLAKMRDTLPADASVPPEVFFREIFNGLYRNAAKEPRVHEGYALNGGSEWNALAQFYREVFVAAEDVSDADGAYDLSIHRDMAKTEMNDLLDRMIAQRRKNRSSGS